MADVHSAAEWRPIPDFPGYQVSSDGRVRRVTPSSGYARKWPLPYELNQHKHKDDYLVVILFRNGRRYRRHVHLLVLEVFKGHRPAGLVGAHDDGDVTNNAASNLFWKTQQQNIDDKSRHGTVARGERNGVAKLTAEVVRAIRDEYARLREGKTRASPSSVRILASKYDVSTVTVRQIARQRTWKHVG